MMLLREIEQCIQSGTPAALVTVIRAIGSSPRKIGVRMLVLQDGTIRGTIGGGTVEHQVIQRAMTVIKDGTALVYQVNLARDLGMCCGGSMEFFIEPIERRRTLYLFGAGHVALELCSLASRLGYQVQVIDDREEFNTQERFPDAAMRLLEDPIDVAKRLPDGPDSAAVIVTHLHRLDEDLLRVLVGRSLGYLGMIGSRSKVARFCERLEARGIARSDLDAVHMPIGLDIGAQTPAEIAVAIAGELILVKEGKGKYTGKQLSWRPSNAG